MTTDFTGIIPHGWSGGDAITKWWRGKFVHLYRLRKNCAQCGKEMTLDVTKAAIIGQAKNAGLHLVRCDGCRAKTPRDITSRPTVRNNEPEPMMVTDIEPVEEDSGSNELQRLRAQNEAFLKSVQVLQARNAELVAEVTRLKNKYELQGVVNSVAAAKAPLTMEESTALLQKALQNKMPWQS